MLELGQYKENFHEAGYEIEADMENLKRLNEKDLREMGISKRGNFNFNSRLLVVNTITRSMTLHV